MPRTFKLTSLELLYPPVSNQEAIWLETDRDVEEVIRQSAFYMIGARQEVRFSNFEDFAKTKSLDVVLGEATIGQVRLAPERLGPVQEATVDSIDVALGEKVIRVFGNRDGEEELLDWFTTEKLLFERSRNYPGISGLNSYQTALTYDLLYVGIAKKGDTFDRLFKRAHKQRQTILGNEPQRNPNSRVTDEVFLFAFDVNSTFARTYVDEHDFTDSRVPPQYDRARIVADAEKAFVSLLRPSYNNIKYLSYPRGVDGLYGTELDAYGYTIRENIVFNTPTASIRGARAAGDKLTENADVLFVRNNDALILRPS